MKKCFAVLFSIAGAVTVLSAAQIIGEAIPTAPKGARVGSYAEALKCMGHDNARKDSFVFLHATDLHSSETDTGATRMPNKFEGKCFINDMNALDPVPAFALFTGDMISETSMKTNTWPRAEKYWARFRRIVADRVGMPMHLIIGNNDSAGEPYKKVFPERPLYWNFTQGGICFIGVHGYGMWQTETSNHSGILIDPVQLAEIDKVVTESQARTLVIVTHEPLWGSDTHRARRQLAPILKKFRGEEIWNIAGHDHSNVSTKFEIGGRTVYGMETTTPVGVWKPTVGAYRIVTASCGRIDASALRWLTKDGDPVAYEIDDNIRPKSGRKMFEEMLSDGAVKTYLVGEEDLPLRRKFTAIEDRLSCLRFYRKGASATYCVPLSGTDARTLRLAARFDKPEAVMISKDGINWQQAAITVNGRFSDITIPQDWSDIYFRIGKQGYDINLFGFALLK